MGLNANMIKHLAALHNAAVPLALTALCFRLCVQEFLIGINVDKAANIQCWVPRENNLQK